MKKWILAILLASTLAACASVGRKGDIHHPQRQAVIEEAKSLLGCPYRYGGHSPAGFDCSGFVGYVYQHAAKIKLPRRSQDIFQHGQPIALGGETAGDLIFFSANGPGASHVGIYLGQGNFIHAPGQGDKVKISNANDDYWFSRLQGIRRFFP
jgi:cell wall-associated NlpC family hydrolase